MNKQEEQKAYHSDRNKRYCRSLDGVVSKIYAAQKRTSKTRGHSPPQYSKLELYQWMKNNCYVTMHSAWVDSGYSSKLIPSVDRIKDHKPYTLDNIQLLTWEENNSKPQPAKFKPVIQRLLNLDFKAEFNSLAEAFKETEIAITAISKCCNGHQQTAGGYVWEFKEEK